MENIIISISLLLLLIFCVSAVMNKSILKSAVFLALASAMLSVIMYVSGAVWASVIELSACSGLVTVIFIGAISLSKAKKEEVQEQYADKKRMRYLPLALIAGGALLVAASFLLKDNTLIDASKVSAEDFREIFWNSRQADILGQIISVLVGGIAVFVLFRDSEENK